MRVCLRFLIVWSLENVFIALSLNPVKLLCGMKGKRSPRALHGVDFMTLFS